MYYIKPVILTEADERAFRSRTQLPMVPDECHLWLGSLTLKAGYGVMATTRRKKVKAHNVAWQIAYGDPPSDLFPDHLCEIKFCVNPDHLEWVTAEENARRERRSRIPAGTCRAGLHLWSEQNPILSTSADGAVRRWCRPCRQVTRAVSKRRQNLV